MKNLQSRRRVVFQERPDELSELRKLEQPISAVRRKFTRKAFRMGFIGNNKSSLLEEGFDAYIDRQQIDTEKELAVTANALQSRLDDVQAVIDETPLATQVDVAYKSGRHPISDFVAAELDGLIVRRRDQIEDSKKAEQKAATELALFHQADQEHRGGGFWATSAGMTMLSIIVGIGEWVILVPRLQDLGSFGNNLNLYLFSLVVTILMSLSAHFAGVFFSQNKIALAILALLSSIFLIAALTIIRGGDPNSVVFILINLSFSMLAGIMSFYAAKSSPHNERRSAKKTASNRTRKLQRSLSRIERFRDALERWRQRDAFHSGVAENKALFEHKSALNEEASRIQAQRDTVSDFFASHRDEGHSSSKIAYASGKIARLVAICAILISIALLNWGCGSADEHQDVLVVFDQSMSTTSSFNETPDDVYKKVEGILDLSQERQGKFGVNVYVSSIGSSSIPKISRISLSEGDSYLMTEQKKRRQVVDRFRGELKTAIALAIEKKRSDRMTRANAGLCYLFDQLLDTAPAGSKKTVLIFSDLGETGVYNFTSSKFDTDFVDNNYDKIAKAMTKEREMPSLDGISIEIIHKPSIESETQFLAASAFFKRYFNEHGAREIKTSGGL